MDVFINPQQGIVYSPDYDVRNLLPRIVQSVAHCFDHEYWPGIWDLLRKLYQQDAVARNQEELDERIEDDLIQAMRAFVALLRTTTEGTTPEETFRQAEKRSGWADVREEARFGYLAMVGLVVTALFREAGRRIYENQKTIPALVNLDHVVDQAIEGRRLACSTTVVQDIQADLKRLVRLARSSGITQQQIEDIVRGVYSWST